MAIIKNSKNRRVKVVNNDQILCSKLAQTSEKIIIDALNENITLISPKKIISVGKKK